MKLQQLIDESIVFLRNRDIDKGHYLNDCFIPVYSEIEGVISIWMGEGKIVIKDWIVILNTTSFEVEKRVDTSGITKYLEDRKNPPKDKAKGVKLNTEKVTKKVVKQIDEYLNAMNRKL